MNNQFPLSRNLKTLLQDALQMVLAVSQGYENSGSPMGYITDKSSGMYLLNFILQEASNCTGKRGHSAQGNLK